MSDPTCVGEQRRVSPEAAEMVRLLAVTVDIVTGFDPIQEEPLLIAAVRETVVALHALDPDADPEPMADALDSLASLAMVVPMRRAGVGA